MRLLLRIIAPRVPSLRHIRPIRPIPLFIFCNTHRQPSVGERSELRWVTRQKIHPLKAPLAMRKHLREAHISYPEHSLNRIHSSKTKRFLSGNSPQRLVMRKHPDISLPF